MKDLNRREFISKAGALTSGLAFSSPLMTGGLKIKYTEALLTSAYVGSIAERLKHINTGHPSLHFNAAKLEQLRNQALVTHKVYAKRLYQWMEHNQSWMPPGVTGDQGDEVNLEESGAFLTNASMAFCLSGRGEYLEVAKTWALKMCDFPDEIISNYGVGIYAAGLARAFDWLYHDLQTKDRLTIKSSLVHIIRQMYENAQPGAEDPSWWVKSYIHHDFCIAMGGFGEASLAVLGEIDEANKYAAFARANFDIIHSLLGDDGAWHEGVADWCYTMAPMLWFYGAWESVTGENLHDQAWLRKTATYRLYHWLPDNHYINLNDSFRSGRYSTSGSASCHLLRRLASIFRDGYAQWLAERDEAFDLKPSPKGVYQAPYEGLSYDFEPQEYLYPDSQTVTWNMLWYDPSVKAIAPDLLPTTHHFRNLDIVIMRTGWTQKDAVVSFTCGPLAGHSLANRIEEGMQLSPGSFSHDHADYASFTLFANGQYFIIPPGYARRASRFQNVVNVNGSDYCGGPALRIKMLGFVKGKHYAYAVGDATEGFLSSLGVDHYRRHVLLFANKWLFIFDDLKLGEKGRQNRTFNRFNWTIHSDPAVHGFEIEKNRVIWKSKTGNHKPLSMSIIEPLEFGWEREMFQSRRGKPMMEALRLTKPEFYRQEKQLLSIFSWDDASEEPVGIINPAFVAVLLENDLAVVFAKKPGIPENLMVDDLSNRKLFLFNSNPGQPDIVIHYDNGNLQRADMGA